MHRTSRGGAAYRTAFAEPEFRTVFTAFTVAITGSVVSAVALTIEVFDRTRSPLLSSLTFALGFLPYLLGGTVLSGLVDRVPPRRLLAGCDLGCAGLLAAMAVPRLPVVVLLVMLVGIGTLTSISSGAQGALVRSVVPAEAYVPARSLLRIAAQVAQVGGNAVGGALLILLTPAGTFLASAAALAAAALLVRLGLAVHPVMGRPVPGAQAPERPGTEQPVPGQLATGQSVPGQPLPGLPVPGQLVPGQPLPGLSAPGLPVPGQPVPGQPVPGQPVPGQPLPGLSAPGQMVPGQPVPGQLVPGQSVPGLPDTGAGEREALLRDSLRGLRQVLGHARLRRLLLLGWLVPMFTVAPEAVAAPYVTGQGGSPALIGWWLAALPVGLIAGDLLGVLGLSPGRQRRLVGPAAGAFFVPYLVFLAGPPVAVALPLLAGAGLCGVYSLGLDALVRQAAPEHLFARTMAVSSAGLLTLQGLGFALAGAAAQLAGPAWAIAGAGGCGLVTVIWLRPRASDLAARTPGAPRHRHRAGAGSSAAGGPAAPIRGEAAPGRGDAAPIRGEAAPIRGEAAPIRGEAAPGRGEAAAVARRRHSRRPARRFTAAGRRPGAPGPRRSVRVCPPGSRPWTQPGPGSMP